MKSSAVASPSRKLTLSIPSSSAVRSASSIIAGVRSTPVTVPTLAATARETTPGPQATSSQRAFGSAGTSSASTPSVCADDIAAEAANDCDWWVNSSRIESSYIDPA